MGKETLFKILGILVGIFIWRIVMMSFAKARKAIREDETRGKEEPQSREQPDLKDQWRQTANRLSCSFDPGKMANGNDMSISGRYSGHEVTIRRFGRNYIRFFVAFRRPPKFQVCVVRDHESIAGRILAGHPVFPSRMFFSSQEPEFYCSAESEEAFDRFLDVPLNRSAVLNLVRFFPSGMFNQDGISVRLPAMVPDPDVVRRMIAIADALEASSQTSSPDSTTAPKKNPQPLSPVPAMRSASPAPTGNRAVPVAPAEHQAVPAPKQSPVSRPSSTDSALTVESVCAALFAKSFPGAEERAAFDAMKGRRVRWSGEVQTVMPFSMDFVFGSNKGVRVTLLICTLPQGQSGFPARIKAVAAFPPELRTELEAAKGKTIVFEGQLLKFEPFAREIFLQEASLVS